MDVEKPPMRKDRKSGSSIGRKMEKLNRKRYKIAMGGSADYAATDKKRISDLLEPRYKQPNEPVLGEIRSRIKNANRIAQLELGECGKNTERICECLLVF